MSDELIEVTAQRVEKYLDITSRAREKATPLVEQGSQEEIRLDIMLKMADDYAFDAKHFLKIGDHVRAFGAITVSYTHLTLPTKA